MQSECPPRVTTRPPRRRAPSLGALVHWVPLGRWVGTNTLTPPWLPARWRHPLVGYLAAVLLQVVAVAVMAVLALVSDGVAAPTLFSLLAVALVALTWGTRPSLLATLAGTALLGALLRSPALHIAENEAGRWEVQGLFLIVGGCLSALASRVARERRDARDQAAQLAAVLDASADGLAVFDAAGCLVRGNAALRALCRLDARPDAFAPPLGERVDLFVTRDEEGRSLPPAAWPLARVLRGETLAPPLDLTIRALDGRTVLVGVSGAPLRDAAGRPSGAVLGVRDVTERRHLEREAQARAGQLEAIFASIADGVAVYDTAGRILHTNAVARALFPLEAAPDYLDRPVEGRVPLLALRDPHGRLLPRAQWPLTRMLAGETLIGPRTVDMLLRTPKGCDLQVNIGGGPVLDRDGQRIGAVAVLRDVTERRRLEREVAAERARLREMIDVAPAAVALLTGPEHTVAVANPRYGRVARHPDVPRGRAFRDAFPELAGQGVVALLDEAYRTGTPVARTEMRVRYGRDGDGAPEDTYFNFVFQPLRDASGTVEGVLIHGVEVTAQVAARRRGEDLAAERDRARADFVATVSHELRTPLTSIQAGLGFLERAVGDHLGPDERDLLDAIRRNAERLRVQIAGLLAANRLDAGALHPARAALDLAAVVRTALAEVRPLLDEKEQGVTLDLPTSLPIAGDARLLGQVVANLLVNVYRHTAAGTRVTLAGRVTGDGGARDGDEVRLTVGDDGPGIPVDEVEAIFRRFHRADTVAGGSGLGLSIAREIVALHGGRLWAGNAAGGGAVFHLALPYGTMDAGDTTGGAAMTPTILIAEDDRDVATMVAYGVRLTWPDCRMEVASGGAEALRLFATEAPDLVVLDVSMPSPDGFEVCRRIREVSTAPILMLTARDTLVDKIRALDLGADDYLTKPFDDLELLARLRALLRRAHGLTGAEMPAPPARVPALIQGDVALDTTRREVRVRGEAVRLTSTEYRLLEELVRHAGRTLPHRYLLEQVWGPEYIGEAHYLRVFVRRLRQKLGDDPDHPRYIQTEWHTGYRFVPAVHGDVKLTHLRRDFVIDVESCYLAGVLVGAATTLKPCPSTYRKRGHP